MVVIDAKGVYYRDLNERVRREIEKGEKYIKLVNVNGQRYIGAGLKNKDVYIEVEGTAGEDLGVFMDGPTIRIHGNAQDGVGNTMNSGKIIIEGMAGDVLGYGMRGGRVYIRDNVGYRVGIHMKGYFNKIPIIVIGGKAGDFFGEYMAGGRMILLGITGGNIPITGDYVGTGMHGGAIFIRGHVPKNRLGKEVGIREPDEDDMRFLREVLEDFAKELNFDFEEIMSEPFIKLLPVSKRPYGRHYVY